MRVLHIVPALFSEDDGIIGGAERYALELARNMADEVTTRLVTFGSREREEKIGCLTIRVIGDPWYVRGQRSNPISLAIIPEIRRADVIHCHQQHVLASSTAAAASRLLRRHVFVTDLGGGGWDVSAYVSTDRWYHGHLHISEYSRNVCGHASEPSAHVILGGVDTSKFSPAETGTPEAKVLYVGRILPHKGINYLVEAMPPEAELEIIGHPFDQRFLADLRKLAAGKQVNFRFGCDDSALVEAYRRASCVVLPSVYQTVYGITSQVPELLGQTLLEGMACGIPVICTDVASMPELVEDGVNGFVVAPNDPGALAEKIQWILAHPREGRAMGMAGRRRVLERFTWPAVVRKCLRIYGVAENAATGCAVRS